MRSGRGSVIVQVDRGSVRSVPYKSLLVSLLRLCSRSLPFPEAHRHWLDLSLSCNLECTVEPCLIGTPRFFRWARSWRSWSYGGRMGS